MTPRLSQKCLSSYVCAKKRIVRWCGARPYGKLHTRRPLPVDFFSDTSIKQEGCGLPCEDASRCEVKGDFMTSLSSHEKYQSRKLLKRLYRLIFRQMPHVVLPWEMVDKSISPLQTHFGPVFGDEAVQRRLLFPESGCIRVLLQAHSSTTPRHDTAPTSGFGGFQAEAGSKG